MGKGEKWKKKVVLFANRRRAFSPAGRRPVSSRSGCRRYQCPLGRRGRGRSRLLPGRHRRRRPVLVIVILVGGGGLFYSRLCHRPFFPLPPSPAFRLAAAPSFRCCRLQPSGSPPSPLLVVAASSLRARHRPFFPLPPPHSHPLAGS